MNSKFNLIFVCFIINLINVFTVNADADSCIEYAITEFAAEVSMWKNGEIKFKIDRNFDDGEIDIILAAMYKIEKSSCIRFVAHDTSYYGPDYVMITKDYANGFASDLGCRHQGKQVLKLAADAMNERSRIMYEMVRMIGIDFHYHRNQHQKEHCDWSKDVMVLLNKFYYCFTIGKRKSNIFYGGNRMDVSYYEMQIAKRYFEENALDDFNDYQMDEQLDGVNDTQLGNYEAPVNENGAGEAPLHDDSKVKYDDVKTPVYNSYSCVHAVQTCSIESGQWGGTIKYEWTNGMKKTE